MKMRLNVNIDLKRKQKLDLVEDKRDEASDEIGMA
jgi:hypothetical protein